MTHDARWYMRHRLGGLRRFAAAISVLTIVGHLWLGFEQAWSHVLAALAATYGTELVLEGIDAWAQRRRPKYAKGFGDLVTFLLPAHITGLAIAMLLYPGDRLLPVAFAGAAAIGSKAVFRVTVKGRPRHFLNPSNFGLALTFILFPWVGLAPPYMFTSHLGPVGDWALPAFVIVSGTLLNARYTHRLPLLSAWVGGFVLQALVRHFAFDASLAGALMPIGGMAFLLFTFYMVTDPATTPVTARGQVAFGACVALGYGCLMLAHVVFGMFFALAATSIVRGAALALAPASQTETTPAVGLTTGELSPSLER